MAKVDLAVFVLVALTKCIENLSFVKFHSKIKMTAGLPVQFNLLLITVFNLLSWTDAMSGSGGHVKDTLRAPSFAIEPPHRVLFSNSSGAVVNCNAMGEPPPKVTWILALDAYGSPGQPLVSEATLSASPYRVVRTDGSLLFPPFAAGDFRADVHATGYQCTATNTLGTVVSRTVQVRAGKKLGDV